MIWTDLSWFSSYFLTNRFKFDLIFFKKKLKTEKILKNNELKRFNFIRS